MGKGDWMHMQLGATLDDGRPDSDFYSTPTSVVEDFLNHQNFFGGIWEPACGAGNISNVLIDRGYTVVSSDLYDWGYGNTGVDFLKQEKMPEGCSNIVTNPPFRPAEDFAWHGINLLKGTRGEMALFNRLAWLESQRRYDLFTKTPIKKVWVLSARAPMMHRPDYEGKKIKTGTVAYAWFVWEDGYKGEPTLGWIL